MSSPDYDPVVPDARMEDDVRQLVRLTIREDLERQVDWTTVSLLSADQRGECCIVSRQNGVCSGLAVLPWILDEVDADLVLRIECQDMELVHPGQVLALVSGSSRDLLTTERTLLNFLCRMCGIATLTREYVKALESSPARLYDTRKTTPGWRRLEKYATRCGGAHNHRTGLFDGFLIKDNHLALAGDGETPLSAGEAVQRVKLWRGHDAGNMTAPQIVELEVDSLTQLREGLVAGPNIILLDNFSIADLRIAVALRDELNPNVELEASGGVHLQSIAEIGRTGVDRISCGALTHSARWLDLGMDWQ